MSWNLKGSYVETSSCDLMCACNFSFDRGATYDYCRVATRSNINAFGIEYEGKSGVSTSDFSWAA